MAQSASSTLYEIDLLLDKKAALVHKGTRQFFPMAHGISTGSNKEYYFHLIEGDAVSFNVLVFDIASVFGDEPSYGTDPILDCESISQVSLSSFTANFYRASVNQTTHSPFEDHTHTMDFIPLDGYESLYFGTPICAYQAQFGGQNYLNIKYPGRYAATYSVMAKVDNMARNYSTDPEWIVSPA
ncbi:MAG: hypothetical protein AAGD01_17310 [Acidobacteriota bacterium]